MSKKVSFIIPVYNEQNTISEVIKQVLSVHTGTWKKEIIIVDDGSTDGTRKKLSQWENKCSVIYLSKNFGRGYAIRAGIQQAKGDIFFLQDADLEYDPHQFMHILSYFENQNVSIVYGSRYLGASLQANIVFTIGNKMVSRIAGILLGIHITDMETATKAFRRYVIEGIRLQSNGFDFDPEFTAKATRAGYFIHEVPIPYRNRSFLQGKKFNWRDGIDVLFALFRYGLLKN